MSIQSPISYLPSPDAAPARVCYIDGGFVPEEAARVSVFDHGLLYGDGVFDTVVAWRGSLFRLDDHIARLFRSMKAVGLEGGFSAGELKSLTLRAVTLNGLENAYV